MQVRLTRKLAEYIDGVDLTRHDVGDVFDVPVSQANLLIAEGWAETYRADVESGDVSRPDRVLAGSGVLPRAEASDEPTRAVRSLDRIRQLRSRLEQRQLTQAESRRAEDTIREELRDSRARTVKKNPGKRR